MLAPNSRRERGAQDLPVKPRILQLDLPNLPSEQLRVFVLLFVSVSVAFYAANSRIGGWKGVGGLSFGYSHKENL